MNTLLARYITRRSRHWPRDERQQAEEAIRNGGFFWLLLAALLAAFRR